MYSSAPVDYTMQDDTPEQPDSDEVSCCKPSRAKYD